MRARVRAELWENANTSPGAKLVVEKSSRVQRRAFLAEVVFALGEGNGLLVRYCLRRCSRQQLTVDMRLSARAKHDAPHGNSTRKNGKHRRGVSPWETEMPTRTSRKRATPAVKGRKQHVQLPRKCKERPIKNYHPLWYSRARESDRAVENNIKGWKRTSRYVERHLMESAAC